MNRPFHILVLLWLAGPGLWGAQVSRVALVIGNDRYEQNVGALRNPGNDAKAVARALRGLGFTVMERHDLKRDALLKAMDDFRKSVAGAQVALFYYAGHGLSVAGENYLIPIKSGYDPAGADSVSLRMLAETHLFNVEEAVADMTAGGAKCTIAILDACRTSGLAASQTRGLGDAGTLVEMSPPTGSLIAFATDSGHTALDGDGKNGLYTQELLKNLTTPGITIEQVFKRTRGAVIERSDGAQVPAEYSRLVGEDIYLAGEQAAPVPAPAQTSPAPSTAAETQEEKLADICKLAAGGSANATECINELKTLVQQEGPGDYATVPLDTLLEQVKEELKKVDGPSTKAITSAAACDLALAALPACVPPQSPKYSDLEVKANNRRGDALLLLGRAADALAAYNAALQLRPTDAYVLYNIGNAHLALGQTDAARADYEASEKNAADLPKAKRLAHDALQKLK